VEALLLAYANNYMEELMSRPIKIRRISCSPQANYFKPRGVPVAELEEVVLTKDELEAIRLADLDEFYQEKAATAMQISRQTFGNIVRSAHKKIADALLNGKALKIEGGVVKMEARQFQCQDCKHEWTLPFGTGRPMDCPQCQGKNIFRVTKGKGRGRRAGSGQPQGRCRRA
jgi:predicted DNA-binding protein (UPF0251 family)